jgi:hypothetical protein
MPSLISGKPDAGQMKPDEKRGAVAPQVKRTEAMFIK